jgi:hypothetical protein
MCGRPAVQHRLNSGPPGLDVVRPLEQRGISDEAVVDLAQDAKSFGVGGHKAVLDPVVRILTKWPAPAGPQCR